MAHFAHFPGAGILLILSLGTLAIVYFPAAVYFFADKEIKRQNYALSVVSGLFLSIVPLGVLFKVMYWEGASSYFLVALGSTNLLLVIVYVMRAKAEENLEPYFRNMLLRTLFWCALSYVFYFTPTASLIQLQHSDDPKLARLKIQHIAHPENEEYDLAYTHYMLQKDSILIEKALK